MIKELFIFFLIISFSFPTTVNNATTNNPSAEKKLTDGLTFYTHSFSVTSANVSTTRSAEIFAGMVYGGMMKYSIVASLHEKVQGNVKLVFIREFESIYINLNSTYSNWQGTIVFSGCCNNILKNLYVQMQFDQKPFENQSGTIFKIFYSIYQYKELDSSSTDIFGGSTNALGYPSPPRIFIVGLIVLMIGTIPTAIIVWILKGFLRRNN